MRSHRLCIINAIRIGIVLIVVGTAVALWAGPRAAWFYVTGRTNECSLAESVEAAKLTSEHLAFHRRIRENTRLIKRDPQGFSQWDTPYGQYWTVSESRDALEWDLAEQVRKIYGKGEKGEHAGDIVLDCGANVGLYAKTAIESGAAMVVAVEPAPENLECLRRNLAKEIATGKVIVYPKGVWDKDDVLTLHSDPKNSARDSLLPLSGSGISQVQVPLTTIDKLVRELGLRRVDFIKMDIEGAEKNAIRGAHDTLRRFKPRMALCVYHLPGDPVLIPDAVRSIDPSYIVSLQGVITEAAVVPEVAHFR